MSFQPVLPSSGLTGWRFLQKTYDSQLNVFSASAARQREASYFTEKIGQVTSAAELVADRRLLGVALGAFGLQSDLQNTYFVRKILEDGSTSRDGLANRLSDKRYLDFTRAFGLGPGEVRRTSQPAAMAEILQQHRVASFEVAVGEQDDTMRIALYAQRSLTDLATEPISANARWFKVMSLPPLRTMMETALGLPSSFGRIDIDQQKSVFEDKLAGLTGSKNIAQFADPEALEKLTTTYLARAQINAITTAASPMKTALMLLQS
ncbi:DUF1217 domain-containing protein [Lutimaribacter marinistellae]|uniref:DUF1217 domain-containing protein n=1 Tax=Lutimaribacter marinistellae TaxID=1820329 RepID=A0ABV7TAH9_9RHOB